jgi:hypothetical protein
MDGYVDIVVALAGDPHRRRMLASALRAVVEDPDGKAGQRSTNEIAQVLQALWETWYATRHHGSIMAADRTKRGMFPLVWGMGKPYRRIVPEGWDTTKQ